MWALWQFVFYCLPTCTATASDPTGAGGQSTFLNIGIPIIAALITATGTITAAVIARCVCCPNKCKCKYAVSAAIIVSTTTFLVQFQKKVRYVLLLGTSSFGAMILKSDIIVAVWNVAKQNIGLKTNVLVLDSYLLKTHL